MSQGFTNPTAAIAVMGSLCEGRLTLTSGTPVTTSDVSGATNIYFTPFKGNRISLYDGSSNWKVYTFSEITQALGTITSDLPYDVFSYLSGANVVTEIVAWTNGTTRATALVLQDGVYVKSGATTRRYLGTFYTISTTQTSDTTAKRYLWNYYNRVSRLLLAYDTTASWTFVNPNGSWREARSQSTYGVSRVGVIVGVSEDLISLVNLGGAIHSSANSFGTVGIAMDRSNNNDGFNGAAYMNSTYDGPSTAKINIVPAAGFHFFARTESGQSGATTMTFYGPQWSSDLSGLTGYILA